jgi:predicted phage terminase large subunit-like protein
MFLPRGHINNGTVKAKAPQFNPEVILVEAEGPGISLAQTLYQETHLPIHAVRAENKSKAQRAWEVTSIIEGGNVWLPEKAMWLDTFLEEMSCFPNSRYSDQVDTLSQALSFLRHYRPRGEPGMRLSADGRPSSGREPFCPGTRLSSGSFHWSRSSNRLLVEDWQ